MTIKQHLLVSIVFFAILLFEFICFTDIIKHPYMVGLCLFLFFVGGWNFGCAVAKGKIKK